MEVSTFLSCNNILLRQLNRISGVSICTADAVRILHSLNQNVKDLGSITYPLLYVGIT